MYMHGAHALVQNVQEKLKSNSEVWITCMDVYSKHNTLYIQVHKRKTFLPSKCITTPQTTKA